MIKTFPQRASIMVSIFILGFSFGSFFDSSRPVPCSSTVSKKKNIAASLSKKKNIAVIVVGQARWQSIPVWLSIRQYIILPILEHYDVPRVDVFICVGNGDMDKSLIEVISSSNSTLNHVRFLETNVANVSQFIRIDRCYEQIQLLQRFNKYDFIVKTRPDILWFKSIALPFLTQHVMARARAARGLKNVTIAHFSYHECNPYNCSYQNSTINTPCGMIDDQIAVVPSLHQDAFFRIEPNVSNHSFGISNTTESSEIERPMLSLLLSCPCLFGSFPEGRLTTRLANLNVTIALAPFHVLLTNKNGPGFRSGYTPQKNFSDFPTCVQPFYSDQVTRRSFS